MPFELPFGVAVLNPVPVDYYSGPYTASNIQQAINIASASIPYGVRFQSMEVRLIIAGVSKKYWYRDNITDLVEFSSIGSGNSDVFYNIGGTVSATNSTTDIYRTGSINIGTGTASNSRFVVSSSGGTVSLVVNEQGLMTLPSVTNTLIDTDTTGKSVVTKEYVNNRLVSEKSTDYTLQDSDSGGIIIFTTSATCSIPTGLTAGFECTFVTLVGATLTVSPGSNTLYNNVSTVMLPQLSFTLKRRIADNSFIATGNL